FEEAFLLNQSERTQVQVYETEITNLNEEIKTLAKIAILILNQTPPTKEFHNKSIILQLLKLSII
ncbi:19083_t:CDS:1, partial [Gigaspora rosea]